MAREVVRQGKRFRIYNDGTILMKDVRFSYVHTDPWAKKETDKPKHSVVGLIPKSDASYTPLKEELKKRIQELIVSGKLGKVSNEHWFLRDGDKGSIEQHEGYFTINCSSGADRRPSFRGPDAVSLDRDDARDKIRSGFWGDILIKPWPMKNEHGRKVNAELIAMQVKKKDKQFGQQRIGEDELDETFDTSDDWDDSDGGFDDDGAYDDADDMGGL